MYSYCSTFLCFSLYKLFNFKEVEFDLFARIFCK